MKINLYDIAVIIEEVTGITLRQLRFKSKVHEITEARQLFIITAFEHGIYKNISEITDFVNQKSTIISYARKQRYRKEIHDMLIKIKSLIKEKSEDKKTSLKNIIPNMSNDDKITIANIIIDQLPKHKRQLIIH